MIVILVVDIRLKVSVIIGLLVCVLFYWYLSLDKK